jgi:hypothetical protein
MRIYSKTLLSWPLVIHISQAARLYPGQWQNYYLYRITNRYPNVKLKTYSPIKYLQENSSFFCYDKYNCIKEVEKDSNELSLICNSLNKSINKQYIYIPKSANVDDILVVYKDNLGFPSLYIPSLFKSSEPTPA